MSRLKWCSWCCCCCPSNLICGRCHLCRDCCRCPPPCLPCINPMPQLPCMPCMGPPPPPTRIVKEHILVPFPVPVPMCSPMPSPCSPWCQPSCFPCMPSMNCGMFCGGAGDCCPQICVPSVATCSSPPPCPPVSVSNSTGASPCCYEPDPDEEIYNPKPPTFPRRSYFSAKASLTEIIIAGKSYGYAAF